MRHRGGDITHFGLQERTERSPWTVAICKTTDAPQISIPKILPDWEVLARQAIEQLVQYELSKSIENLRLDGIERELRQVTVRLRQLEARRPLIVPIESFAPEPYDLVAPFHVVLEPSDEEFIATFFDAGVSATGETELDAISNLKDLTLAIFEALQLEKDLGPGPAKQLTVLKQFIRKTQ